LHNLKELQEGAKTILAQYVPRCNNCNYTKNQHSGPNGEVMASPQLIICSKFEEKKITHIELLKALVNLEEETNDTTISINT
jgi:hypothetical protein